MSALPDVIAYDEAPGSKAAPFLKWVGGKRSIIGELKKRLPQEFNNYYEPFVGGGALFFEIQPMLENAYLSDANMDLIITYSIVKKEPDILMELLKKYAKNHCEKHYYRIRGEQSPKEAADVAARLIYLNKTCFNGLFRVNRNGEFNVPMGKYVNPGICREENLRACSHALKMATIEYKDYRKITPQAGDFVYFDPPYHPTGETSFTSYSTSGFTEKDQSNLAEFCVSLHQKGVRVMVSNSNTGFIRELYKSGIFHVEIVNAPRMVNCKTNGRSAVEEVLITNYSA